MLNRRHLLALLAAVPLTAAKSRLSKTSVSVITDEVGTSQSEAMAFVKHFNLQWIELRYIPGTQKEFAGLREPELKAVLAELKAAKLKVALVHTAKPGPAAEAAATLLETRVLNFNDPGVWEPAAPGEAPNPTVNVRVDALQPLNWRRTFEALQRNNYQGRITLKTEPAKADEAMRELMHYIGEL